MDVHRLQSIRDHLKEVINEAENIHDSTMDVSDFISRVELVDEYARLAMKEKSDEAFMIKHGISFALGVTAEYKRITIEGYKRELGEDN